MTKKEIIKNVKKEAVFYSTFEHETKTISAFYIVGAVLADVIDPDKTNKKLTEFRKSGEVLLKTRVLAFKRDDTDANDPANKKIARFLRDYMSGDAPFPRNYGEKKEWKEYETKALNNLINLIE